jgi:hypothetical protein
MAPGRTTAAPARDLLVTGPDGAPAQDALTHVAVVVLSVAELDARLEAAAERGACKALAGVAAAPAPRGSERITYAEAAQILRLDVRSVQRHVARGLLHAKRVVHGGKPLLLRSEVERLLSESA